MVFIFLANLKLTLTTCPRKWRVKLLAFINPKILFFLLYILLLVTWLINISLIQVHKNFLLTFSYKYFMILHLGHFLFWINFMVSNMSWSLFSPYGYLVFQHHLLKIVSFFHIRNHTTVQENNFLCRSVFILDSLFCSTDQCAYHETSDILCWLL